MTEKNILNKKAIGERLRKEREKLGLSREEFASLIDLSDYYVGQLERGERQMSLPALVKISQCLHTSIDYLIFGKNFFTTYVYDSQEPYEPSAGKKDAELEDLLQKCSTKELVLIKKLIKTILPHI